MHIDNHVVLIVVSSIVLISHFFNLLAKTTRVPSVILLIAFGALLKGTCYFFNVDAPSFDHYLSFLGSVGLILIVLEGASDLKLKKQNFPLIKSSFNAALAMLLLSVSAIGALFHFWLGASWKSAFVNSIPLAVISSAIAIPTVMRFIKSKKEFLIYESVFSDVIGIMLFNYMIIPSMMDVVSIVDFGVKFVITIITSVVASFLLLLTLHYMKTQTKFFIILALLVLVYGVGEMFHLSSLLLVFIFGLFLNNFNFFRKNKVLAYLPPEEVDSGIEQFKLIVAESAFLIRTFFFVIFGYSINLGEVFTLNILIVGIPVIAILYVIRFVYLKFIIKSHVFPEIFIAPKGLVTILLFLSIPEALRIPAFGQGHIFFVIVVSGLIMIISGISEKHLIKKAPA